jgi:adenosylmethionine-8-amino-7-oxononanoate aminotransferase
MKNSPSSEDLHSWDREHFIHPWHDMNYWRDYDNMLVTQADGIYMYDETGKKFIDGPGGMWCVQIGYGQKEMADAIAAQVMQMPFASPWTNVT